MLKQLLKIIRQQGPTHLVIAFDRSRNTFRRNIHSGYKAHRRETPYPLKEQYKTIQRILERLGAMVLSDSFYEADDLIGSSVASFHQSLGADDVTAYLMSKDHDYLQLVDDRTTLWLGQARAAGKTSPMGSVGQDGQVGQTVQVADSTRLEASSDHVSPRPIPDNCIKVTPSVCHDLYGVFPGQIPDLKGLAGDKSDNIPGVKGVSTLTAVPLLNKYGSIEKIYEAIDSHASKGEVKVLAASWKKELGLKRDPMLRLVEQKKMAYMSKDLATIRTNADTGVTADTARFSLDMGLLEEVCQEYEFRHLFASHRFAKMEGEM